MLPESSDPTKRFSDRVANYARCRPRYPTSVYDVLGAETGLSANSIIADVGSGTGFSSELFLERGNVVYAIEPNQPMRQAAENLVGTNPRFHSVDGTAENTTLGSDSVDYVVAGQAFHWFNKLQARLEFLRILRPRGWVVVFWNTRRIDSTPFLREYEAYIEEHAIEARQADHRDGDDPMIREFFAPMNYEFRRLANQQKLDEAGLIGRITSSSYMPNENHPQYTATIETAKALFLKHQCEGNVIIEYDLVMYFGRLT
jgi:SAM-dependent methyltransferase